MFMFKDNPNCTRFYFINGFRDGTRVRMYATADTRDAFSKIHEYETEGLKVTAALKTVKSL